MSETLSASAIASAVAEDAAQRITRKVIADLQRIDDISSGDDSELKTIWDHICVQVQGEHSLFWDAYDQTVRPIVVDCVSKLLKYEREALWLQTDAGIDWDFKEADDREAYPVIEDDIVNYVVSQYVYAKAGEWSNARIRAYLDRSTGELDL